MADNALQADAAADDSGFTLLEVIIAFFITAMMLGMVAQVFSGGFASTERAANAAAAALLTRSVLAATGVEEPLAPGTTRGIFANGFGWERRVEPIANPAVSSPPSDGRRGVPPPPVFYQVTVRVVWPGGGDGVRVVTYRLGPGTEEKRP